MGSRSFSREHADATSIVKQSLGIPGDARMDAMLQPRPLKKGQHLYRQNDVAEDVHFLLDGTLKAYRVTNEGDEGVVRFYYPGDLLWTDGTASGRHSMSVVSIDTGRVCSMPLPTLQRLMSTHHSVQLRCYELLSQCIQEEQAFINTLCHGTAERRVAFFLLQVYRHNAMNGRRDLQDRDLDMPMTRCDIARYLGLRAETLSRVFSKLQESGIVEVRGRHVRVVDPQRLERAAHSSEKEYANEYRKEG